MKHLGLVRWFLVGFSLTACDASPDRVADPPDTPSGDLAEFPVRGVDDAGFVVTLQGHVPLGDGALADEVGAFLAAHAPAFGLQADLGDVVLDRQVDDIGGTTLRYYQVVDGVPVFEGELVAGVAPDRALIHVRNDFDPLAASVATRPVLSADEAVRIAEGELGVAIPGATRELVIVRGDKLAPGRHLAWKIGSYVETPRGDWLVFVDAADGAVVRTIDMLKAAGDPCEPCDPATQAGCGRVFHENPVDLTDNTALIDSSNVDAAMVGCSLGHLTSGTNLTGQYVNTSITAAPRVAPPYDYLRSANQSFVDEITVYHHLDRAKMRLNALGFPGVMNFSINTDAHDAALGDNAHYVPSTKILEFGVGGVDDAQDPDVAYHEYGHAIQDNQVIGYGTQEEGGAAGEGFGDYWSAAITEDSSVPVLSSACLGSYDAVAYNPYTGAAGTGCLRRLDGAKQYPRDRDWEVHDDGEMWSAALWRLRGVLGGDVTDALVIKSHTYLTSSAQFINLADAVISADVALHGGANAAAIHAAFKAGGIPRTGTSPALSGPVSTTAFSCGLAPYGASAYKECTYTQPGALWMQLHFSSFNTETGWDFAYISDADFRQVQALSGNLGASSSLRVAGDTIVLRFKADASINKPGFMIDQVSYRQGCTSNAQCSDGNACNGAEVCSAGVCGAGTPLSCNDGNVCTTDSCNPASGCVAPPVADGTSCADPDTCNGGETCQAGVCSSGTPLTCDDDNVCTADTCDAGAGCTTSPLADGTACDDGTVCNGAETCQTGGCAPGTALDCDDGDACTADSCDAVSGCAHTATPCTGPATCSYDGVSGVITVAMHGVAGVLTISSGNILLGGVTCGTTTGTDSIVVNGTGGLTIRGDYGPGRTAEGSGASEIEFSINNNIVTFDGAAGNDNMIIVPGGADLNGDGDQDVVLSGGQTKLTYKGGAGNDTLDASAASGTIYLYGGGGNDHLIGGSNRDYLYGDAGTDTLEGNGGNDLLYGGADADVELGGAGADIFREDATANGADVLDGGADLDTLDYAARTAALFVTLGDAIANDGASGEGDGPVAIERVTGGAGSDTLTGTSAVNVIRGGGGADVLHGGGAADSLFGDDGDDTLDGEAGPDKVNCGAGTDTAQDNTADTFTDCEILTP